MRFIIKNSQVLENCVKAIQEIKLEDNMQVEIKPYVAKRSLAQNDLYHMWIDDIRDYTGYTKDQQKKVFQAMYLPIKKSVVNGIELTELTSTTELNVNQFSDYLKEIEAWAVEWNVSLRYPQELMYAIR